MGDEAALKSAMHPDVRSCMQSKRILLFGEMLTAAGFPSAPELVHQMSAGFPPFGAMPRTGVF
eukprot:5691296-Heterocapsa_arctica.AAC.1